MSKVLFINGGAHGHVNPTLALVEELVKRGEVVTYFSTEEFRQKIESTGAIFYSYENPAEHINPRRNENLFALLELILKSCNVIVPSILNQTKGEKFDYIIYDNIFGCGKYISHILKLPAVSSYATFPPPNGDNAIILHGSKIIFLKMLITGIPYVLNCIKIARKLKKAYDITYKEILNSFSGRGNLNIVYTSKYFQHDACSFDDTFKFVGPSIRDRNVTTNFCFDAFKEKKVIYISLGTIFELDLEFYKICFEALKSIDMQIVLYICDSSMIEQLKDTPANFIVTDNIPQLEILKYTELFITHGGVNSVSEALLQSVPMVVIPLGADQYDSAKRIEELGAGVKLRRDIITPSVLKDAVQKVLADDSFRHNAGVIAETLKRAGGYKRAADEIFKFKKQMKIR